MFSSPGQLAVEMKKLSRTTTHELRMEWRHFYRTNPPRYLSRDALLRGVLYKVQERAYGGLSRRAERALHRLTDKAAGLTDVSTDPSRALTPGTRLLRQWRGCTYTVLVQEKGFDYDGRRYRSLTQIAKEITGAHWSGPRFFGLNPRSAADAH